MRILQRTLALFLVISSTIGCGAEQPTDGAPDSTPGNSASAPNAKRPDVPDIFVITADDLGWADVGFHGAKIGTETIDRMAKQGIVLETFYAAPVGQPTRAAILTGREPNKLGLVTPSEQYQLPRSPYNLPLLLRERNYRTIFLGKWNLGISNKRSHPMQHGFEHFYGNLHSQVGYNNHEYRNSMDWQRNRELANEKGYITSLVGLEAIELIHATPIETPMFTWVSFQAPHLPAEAPLTTLQLFGQIRDEQRRVYMAQVHILDFTIGKIVEALEESGRLDNCVIVFLSDNGGALNASAKNAPLRGGKRSCFEGGLRVPAVIWAPGRLEGEQVLTTAVTATDLYPTILSLAGIPIAEEAKVDGVDLWPLLKHGEPLQERDLCFAYSSGSHTVSAIRRGNWKLVRTAKLGEPTLRFLFDIAADPHEEQDLAPDNPDLVAELAKVLDAWIAENFANATHGKPVQGPKMTVPSEN